MLTSIVKATRAHFAALQHKAAPDRVALEYLVGDHAGRIWVKAATPARKRMEVTKLANRLHAMYPEVPIKSIHCNYGVERQINWKPQVKVDGQWAVNALVFATKDEALKNAENLMMRWMLVTDFSAIETTDPVNYKWVDSQLERVK